MARGAILIRLSRADGWGILQTVEAKVGVTATWAKAHVMPDERVLRLTEAGASQMNVIDIRQKTRAEPAITDKLDVYSPMPIRHSIVGYLDEPLRQAT